MTAATTLSPLRALVLLVVATCSLAGPAEAYTDWSFSQRGYLLTRAQHFGDNERALLHPLVDAETLRALAEANAELQAYGGDEIYLYTDVSALLRMVPTECAPGDGLVGCLVLNESYAEWRPIDWLRFLVGRHRVSWGDGLSAQPIEALNPRPDPTDPSFQRLGVWMLLAEAAFFDFMTTLVVAPEVDHFSFGLPSGLDPLYGSVAARVAWRASGFNVAGIGYLDYGLGLPSGGATGSWSVWEGLVLHGQFLVHTRREIETGALEEGSCPGIGTIGIPHRKELDLSALVGARYDFSDGTLLSAEYLHNADGMTKADFTTTLTTVSVIKAQCPNAKIAPSDVSKQGRPQQFSNVLLRRSYVVLAGIRPSLFAWKALEDTGVVATALIGVDDLSTILNARIVHTYQQNTRFRLGAIVPVGEARTQFGVLPFHYAVLADVEVSF